MFGALEVRGAALLSPSLPPSAGERSGAAGLGSGLDDIDGESSDCSNSGRGAGVGAGEGRVLRGRRWDYRVVKRVGHGTFGEVLQCVRVPQAASSSPSPSPSSSSSATEATVAVKRVFLQKQVRSKESCYANTLEHAVREAETLERLAPGRREGEGAAAEAEVNVVSIFEHWVEESQCVLSLAMEFCLTDLRCVLADPFLSSALRQGAVAAPATAPPGSGGLAVAKYVMVSLLRGLSRCHAAGVIHRDIKPGNCLVTSRGEVKLGDFGQATMLAYYRRRGEGGDLGNSAGGDDDDDDDDGNGGFLTHAVSTRWYRAPELLYGSRSYDEKVDLWSLGCTFAEMLSTEGQALARGESDIDQMAKVFQIFGTPAERRWPGVSRLPDFGKIIFDEFEPAPLARFFPDGTSQEFISLLQSMLQVSARA